MKEKIAILTDSAADFPDANYLDKHNILVIPLSITIGGKTYKSGIDITADKFLDLMDQYPTELPKTSQPSPAEFINTFQKLVDQGYTHAIYISLCSKWSGTYETAQRLAKDMDDKIEIKVVDSLIGSAAQALLVERAIEQRERNLSADEIYQDLIETVPKCRLIFVPSTLDNLVKGGRATKLAGFASDLLNVFPIISVMPDGEIRAISKQRGNRAFAKIAENVKAYAEETEPTTLRAHFIHTRNEKGLKLLEKELHKLDVTLELLDPVICGPIISTHGSKGSAGITLCPSID